MTETERKKYIENLQMIILNGDSIDKEYYIYKITNLKNGKNYIGQRQCPKGKTPEGDINYWGSSEQLKLDIKHIGKESFKKDILKKDIHSKSTLNFLEECYIGIYKHYGKAENNISAGGNSGHFLKYGENDFNDRKWNYYITIINNHLKQYSTKTYNEKKWFMCHITGLFCFKNIPVEYIYFTNSFVGLPDTELNEIIKKYYIESKIKKEQERFKYYKEV
jgi:hypothetical protein